MSALKNFLFNNTSDKQTIIKNTFWLAVGQVVGRLIRVLIIIYAARILGAESYGAFSYALSIAALLSILADLGINGTIVRELAKEEREKIIGTAITLKITLLFLIALMIPFLAPYLTNIKEAVILIPIATLIFIFDSIRDTGSAIARAKQKMEYESWAFIITNIAITTLGFTALYLNPNTLYLSIGYALGSLIGTIAIIYFIRNIKLNLLLSLKNLQIKKLLKISLPFAVVSIMGAVMINTDIVMLGWLTSAKETGLYSVAQRPIQLLYIFPGIIATSFFPLTAKLFKDHPERVPKLLEYGLSFLTLLALPTAIIGALFSQELINLFFGQIYEPAYLSLAILSLSIIFVFPSILIGNTIFATGHEKKLITYSLIGITGNIILNLLLIPSYGILGCALATLITQATINSYLIIKAKQILPFKIFKNIYKIIISAIIILLFGLILKNANVYFITNIIIISASYLIILKIIKEPIITIKNPHL